MTLFHNSLTDRSGLISSAGGSFDQITETHECGQECESITLVSPFGTRAQAPAHRCRQRFGLLISKSKSQERETERAREAEKGGESASNCGSEGN